MLTSSRLFLIGGTLVCAAAFARCSDTSTMNTMGDMATTDMATVAVPGSPTLTLASPANAANTGGGTLILTGTNFQSGATVTVGGVAATNVMVVSSTQITCTIPAKTAICGPAAIVVTNPDTKTVMSSTLFTYRSTSMSFAASTALAMSTNTRYVIAADLDKKNGPDLISANSGAGNLAVRLNNGNGSFGAATLVAMGGNSPYAVAAGYVDGDTNIDLVSLQNANNTIKVRLGVGDGTFTTPTGDPTYTVGADARDFAVGDVNGDGKLDVMAANITSMSLSLLLGNGNGSFQAATSTALGSGPVAIILANFGGDAKLDVATADKANNQATVRLQANSLFAAGSTVLSVNAPSDLAAGDFNGDGFMDLAIANSASTTIRVTLGAGDGTFNAAQGATPTVGTVSTSTRSVVVGDFNLDGFLDVAVSNQAERTISILLGDGTGKNFQTKQDFAIGTLDLVNGSQSNQLAVGDLNNDGIPDLVSTDYVNDGVVVLLSQCK